MKYIKHISENLNIDATKYTMSNVDKNKFNGFDEAKRKYDVIVNIYEHVKKYIYKHIGDLKTDGVGLRVLDNNGYVTGFNGDISNHEYNHYVGGYMYGLDDGQDLSEYRLSFKIEFIIDQYESVDFLNKIDSEIKYHINIKQLLEHIKDVNKFNDIRYGGDWINFQYSMNDYINMMGSTLKKMND